MPAADEARELELILLGAILASTKVAEAAFAVLDREDFKEGDIGAVFEELKAVGVGERVKRWLKNRGVTVNGKTIESVLQECLARSRKRRMERASTRLRLAIAAGCEEEVRAMIELLNREHGK